jgi:hypothetical protein
MDVKKEKIIREFNLDNEEHQLFLVEGGRPAEPGWWCYGHNPYFLYTKGHFYIRVGTTDNDTDYGGVTSHIVEVEPAEFLRLVKDEHGLDDAV